MTILGLTLKPRGYPDYYRRRFAIEAHTNLFWGWRRKDGEWFLFLGPFSIVWERP